MFQAEVKHECPFDGVGYICTSWTQVRYLIALCSTNEIQIRFENQILITEDMTQLNMALRFSTVFTLCKHPTPVQLSLVKVEESQSHLIGLQSLFSHTSEKYRMQHFFFFNTDILFS